MIVLLALLLVFLVMIAPVTLRIDARHAQSLDALIALRCWGLGPSLRFRLEKTDHGRRLLRLDRHGRPKPRAKSSPDAGKSVGTLLRQLLKDGYARRFLLRGLSLLQLDVALNISLDNAARTALTSGGLQSLWQALPSTWRRKARLRVRPDFLNGQGSQQMRCMVFLHLGILPITAALLLLSLARERAQQPARAAEEA